MPNQEKEMTLPTGYTVTGYIVARDEQVVTLQSSKII